VRCKVAYFEKNIINVTITRSVCLLVEWKKWEDGGPAGARIQLEMKLKKEEIADG
jgi:hypothetical protein